MKGAVRGLIALAAFTAAHAAAASGASIGGQPAPPVAPQRPDDPGVTSGPELRQPLSGEDCKGFDNSKAEIKHIGGRWKIVDGDHWIADFGDRQFEAKRALEIVKFYRFDAQCFVGRPGPSMTYWKRGDGVPDGDMPDQDCEGFDPGRAGVTRIRGRWKIVEGNHWIADFGGKRLEAFRALEVIRHYGMSRQCFVARPDPSMTYWLR